MVEIHTCILECLKMYKISDKTKNFITDAMKNWKELLTAEGKTLAELKIQRDILHRDTLLPLLFVIATMPLNSILWKYTIGYKFTKSQEKFIHLMYMDDNKVFAKIEKELQILIQIIRIYSQYLLSTDRNSLNSFFRNKYGLFFKYAIFSW